MSIKVSIITVSYNAAATIADTLASVAVQSYPHIEHILIDGGSTDGTMNIASRYPHLKHVVSEKDNGIYDAMNKGIQLASGDIIGILNGDDFYTSATIIEKVVKRFDEPNMDALYGDLVYVNETYTRITRRWKAGEYDPKKLYNGWMAPHPTFFVRRWVYDTYGHYDVSLRYAADYEIMLRFMLKHGIRCGYLPETMVVMKRGGKSNTSLRNRIIINREDRRAWRIAGLRPHLFTLILKPLSKLTQFINL
ncbi:MAG: glycosyltransferase family 2 protein [Bacteroidota bacterium]